MKKSILIACSLYSLISLHSPAQAQDLSVAGKWDLNRDGAYIVIEDCGDSSPCGYLMVEESRQSLLDEKNQEASLRDRTLHGMKMIWDFKLSRNRSWIKGRLYDPDTGKTYRSKIELVYPNTLKVSGCVGPFCRKQIWSALAINK